jgi:ribosome-binding ATPase
MPVNVALIGSDQTGKSTLFNALTQGRGHDGVGMIDIPDRRLDMLAAAVNPKRIVHAQVRLADAPPGSRAQRIAAAREADVVVKVARCFSPDADPAAGLEEIELDLALADLATVSKRLEVVERDQRVGKKHPEAELETLRQAREHLDAGRGLTQLALEPERAEYLRPLFPVSIKPAVYVANVSDQALPSGGDGIAQVQEVAQAHGSRAVVVCAQLEAELGELEPAERAEIRESYGLPPRGGSWGTEPVAGPDALAQALWEAGGLITFFTAGEPEVRAWPCLKAAPAPLAAGVIHSDFEKHFIRAEVTSVDELVAAGSMEALRSAGKLRLEGRDYQVQDGDVLFFRVGR